MFPPLLMEREAGSRAKGDIWRPNCPAFIQFKVEKLLKLENSPLEQHAQALGCIFLVAAKPGSNLLNPKKSLGISILKQKFFLLPILNFKYSSFSVSAEM